MGVRTHTFGGSDFHTGINAARWNSTPLGPVENWPYELRMAVNLLLDSRFPMFLIWGPELTFLYNDACIPIIGKKHPQALGLPFHRVWYEIWEDLKPLIDRALDGEATWSEDQMLFVERRGYREETYLTFSYSPLRDGSGEIKGIFCACLETTGRVISERRGDTLSKLATDLNDVRTQQDVCQALYKIQNFNSKDIPFAALYIFEESGNRARLACQPNIQEGHAIAPAVIEDDTVWPISQIMSGGNLAIVRNLEETFSDLPRCGWGSPSTEAVLVPMMKRGHDGPSGFLVVGLNPHIRFDAAYKEFINLYASHISTGLNNFWAFEEEKRKQDQSQSQFRIIADDAPVALWISEPDGSASYLNHRWFEMTGGTPKQDLGFGWLQKTHPDDIERCRKLFLEAIHNRMPFNTDYRLRQANGEYRWVIDSGLPRFDESGNLLGYVGCVSDIHARKQAEEALRSSEKLYRAIGESINYGVWVCDKQGRSIYASDSFLNLIGLTQEECSADAWVEYLHPDEVEENVRAWRECVEKGEIWDQEHLIRGVDGEWHPTLARGVPVKDENGEILCWAGINLDIKKIKETEAALKEADKRKNEFLATLAHELRNPLAPISNALHTMSLTNDPEKIMDAQAMIDRQVKQMVRLVDDLLDVSRITRGNVELRKADVTLRCIVENAIETARPLALKRDHEITINLPEDEIWFHGDSVRLSQVFANLLNNAAKYTKIGGHITLSAEQREGCVSVVVEDNGIGIEKDKLPRIFEMFSQIDTSLERSHGGLGIGLSLVKTLVELHGGEVIAESEGLGKGSRFIVTLPTIVRSCAEPDEEVVKIEEKPTESLKILVVDDNPESAQTLGMMLELLGHRVRLEYEGEAAIQAARNFQPDMVLLDIGLPKLNGYDVCQKMKALPGLSKTLFVAQTGWGGERHRMLSKEAGFDHHLVKPIEMKTLSGLLSTNMRRNVL